jgi:hypothetical protein
MKTIKKNLFFALIITLIFSANSFAQKTHYVTLNVDTSTITSKNENSVSNFGQDESTTNRNFTIKVNVGDIIIWKGISSKTSADTVIITSINYKGQKNIFGKNHLGADNKNPGQVRGTVVTGKKGDVIKYTISFKVLNKGKKRGGTYQIDPKIQIKA